MARMLMVYTMLVLKKLEAVLRKSPLIKSINIYYHYIYISCDYTKTLFSKKYKLKMNYNPRLRVNVNKL